MNSATEMLDVIAAVGVVLMFLFIFFRILGRPRTGRRPPHAVGRRTDTSRALGGGWQGAGAVGVDAQSPARLNGCRDDAGGCSSSDGDGDGGGGDGGGGGD